MSANEKHGTEASITVRAQSTRSPYSSRRPYGNKDREEITVNELWQILRKRKTTFFICFAIATALAIVISLVLPTRYEAVGKLTVDFDSPGAGDLDVMAKAAGVDPETKLQTQVNILRTDSLAWEVIKRLHLDQTPETAYRKFVVGPPACVSNPGQGPDSLSPECKRNLLDEFHNRLHVQSVPKSEIIEIRFRCRSRELAAKVVNTLAETYVDRNFQTKYQAGIRVSDWLSGQLDEVKQKAETAEEKFIAYQKQTGIIGTDENHNVLIEHLNAINQQLVIAEANRIVQEASYRIAESGDPEALIGITPGSPLQLLHAQETNLRIQYAQLSAKYGDAYPKVIQLQAQLEKAAQETKRELDHARQMLREEYDASLQRESLLRQEFERQKQQSYSTNAAAVQVALLKRDVDASRELYEQLSKKLKEAGILAGLKATNVTIIDPAEIPIHPAEPRPMLNLALGMLAGSLCGVMLCFLHENVDTTIATPNDVAHIGSLPALGIVPRVTDGNGRSRLVPSFNGNGNGVQKNIVGVAALQKPESEMADAYRSLRTALLLSSAGAPPKVLLITSALPREGKTTTSVNTAVVFAQRNRRVLLIDGDLRRADVRRYFDLPRGGGLSAALVGEPPSKFYVTHPDLPNLTILPAGNRPPKPPDLLDSDRMRELMAMWRAEFDQVIIDAPPVIGMSDAVILSTLADTVVLVVRAQQSRKHELSRTVEILASVDANVGGAIINDFDLHAFGYYGYGSSSLYGRYFEGSGKDNASL